ncbi:MAG: trigger factor [Clostridia bacterium]|nr:trigger factor [Clostridia bacterium]
MSLKSSTKAEEANLYSLDIEIAADAFEAACQKAFAKLKNRISIPGFRKGKVTRKMAEAFYGKGFLYEDALDLVYPEAVEGAIKEAQLDVVGTKNADVKEIGENGVALTVEVYVKPDVEIKAYKELKATKKKVEATDEEIEAKLHELVHRNARIIAVEDRAAENGDTTVIDFEGFVDGVAFDGGKGENYELKLGSGSFIPGFEEQIVGHNPGDEFDVNVTFPTDYTPELAGKDAVFKVKLHEIKTEELPEVDDEFAQDAADCDTVDALKKSLADEIKTQKEEQNENEIREQVFEKLIENVVADIPPVMVDSELDNRIRDIDYRLSAQGMNFETYLQYMGMSVEDYREQQREDAEKAVKLRLALEKIVELENLEVTEEDLDKEYEKLAAQYQMEADKIKAIISADSLKKDLSVQKASDFVRENAKVTTARKPRAAKPKTDEADAEAAPAEEASAE